MANYRKRHLSFREVGIPKHIRQRVLLLVILFFVFTALLFLFLNREGSARVSTLSDPTLPEVSLSCYGRTFSPLHGYLSEMDGSYMRDAVVPIKSSRRVPIKILTAGSTIDAISYEIRSLDTSHKISAEKITGYKADKEGNISVEPELSNLIEKGEEYLMTLRLSSGGQDIYYYMRIAIPSYKYVEGCIEFAQKFSDTALSDDDSSIATYIEPSVSADADESNMSNVNLHSSINQIGWRNFRGKRVGKPDLDVVDIGEDYCAVCLHYQMKDKDETPNYYNVKEYIKLRKGIQRYYLLDYNRTMEKILTGENITRELNEIDIGIRPQKMDYISNTIGTTVAFEQAGDLFIYEHSKQRATRIFSFRGNDEADITDSRRNYGEHGIKLLQIEENGSLDYCVYGYMNCGPHEGLCGINLYHYDAGKNLNKEQAFIVSSKSYQVLSASFADLIYESAGSDFYIMLDGTLERVDLDSLKTKELNTGLKSQQFATSADGRYIAWIDGDYASKEISVMDLEDESVFEISAENSGELLRPLAYLEDDLIYGVVREDDITKGLVGSAVYPMYKIVIKDSTMENGEVRKSYEKKNVYVTDVTSNAYSVTLTRVKKSGKGFSKADDDVIRDSAGEQNREVEVIRSSTSGKGTETFIKMTSQASEKEKAPLAARDGKLVLASKNRAIKVASSEASENYYVYVGSSVVHASTDPAKAIKQADKVSGIVVDNDANYIWKRSRPTEYATITDYEADIKSTRLKKARALDLTSLSLDQVLYFVSVGQPVYVDSGSELSPIVGYTPETVTIAHSDGAQEEISIDEARARFEAQGNIYIVYMEKEE